jgi:hypothetical protein
MRIPYGRSNFEEIRRKGYFYVDKTPFLPLLERAEVGYPLFLRPRRFGKSTLLSMLEHYYDATRRDEFDDLFGGLWVHEHPTPGRNAYLVLVLDFSGVSTDSGHDALRRSFLLGVKERVHNFCARYRAVAPELDQLAGRLDGYDSAEGLADALLNAVLRAGHKVYLLIDEYDHFANRLLSDGEHTLYDDAIVKRTGFVRTFYAQLKAATQSGVLERLFVTGVTPLMLDDLSSGFNVATNISLDVDFDTLTGFTRADVARAVDELLSARPDLAAIPELAGRAALLDVMEKSYDGYRFSFDARERVFNPDLVLYFLSHAMRMRRYPGELLDPNVRTQYTHLQRIGKLSGTAAAERRELLEAIVSDGHVRTPLLSQFGARSLRTRAAFLSLLYHLGMLTLRDAPEDVAGNDLEIPNRVIRELQWEHLAIMLEEEALVDVRLDDLRVALGAMVTAGDIAPFLALFHEKVLKAISVRDTRQLGEKTIKLLLMMYASLGHAFHPLTEKELAQGYCDLFLAASPTLPSARYSWLLELKYLKAGSKPAAIEAAFAEAEQQVARYANDQALLPLLVGDRALRAGMVVFMGTKKVLFRPWPPMEASAGKGRAKGKRAKGAGSWRR